MSLCYITYCAYCLCAAQVPFYLFAFRGLTHSLHAAHVGCVFFTQTKVDSGNSLTALGKHLQRVRGLCLQMPCEPGESLSQHVAVMSSEKRAAALLPSYSHPLRPSCFSALFTFLLFNPCSAPSPILSLLFFPLALTPFVFTSSTLLSSNVCPECQTIGYRQKSNISQGRMDKTNRLLQTIVLTLAVVSRRGILHIITSSLIQTSGFF